MEMEIIKLVEKEILRELSRWSRSSRMRRGKKSRKLINKNLKNLLKKIVQQNKIKQGDEK